MGAAAAVKLLSSSESLRHIRTQKSVPKDIFFFTRKSHYQSTFHNVCLEVLPALRERQAEVEHGVQQLRNHKQRLARVLEPDRAAIQQRALLLVFVESEESIGVLKRLRQRARHLPQDAHRQLSRQKRSIIEEKSPATEGKKGSSQKE